MTRTRDLTDLLARSRPAQLGACTLAGMGEREKAIDWLNHALAIDPDFASNRLVYLTFAEAVVLLLDIRL